MFRPRTVGRLSRSIKSFSSYAQRCNPTPSAIHSEREEITDHSLTVGQSAVVKNIYKGLKSRIQIINCRNITPIQGQFDWHPNADPVCSYNEGNDGSLHVPATPPIWDPPAQLPFALNTHEHVANLIHTSGRAVPGVSMAPRSSTLLRALDRAIPTFDCSTIDIIATDLSLFQFITMFRPHDQPRTAPFRLTLVGDTLLIDRVIANGDPTNESSALNIFNRNAGRMAFESRVARPVTGALHSSNYVLQYEMGPLKLALNVAPRAVRKATEKHPTDAKTHYGSKANACSKGGREPDCSSQILPDHFVGIKALALIPTQVSSSSGPPRSMRRHISRDSAYQAWFLRSPKTYCGMLDAGLSQCIRIEEYDHSGEPPVWLQTAIRRTCNLLLELKAATKASQHGVVVCTTKKRIMEVWEPEFDEAVLDVSGVPENLRVKKQIIPDKHIERYWHQNKMSSPEAKKG